MSPPVQLATGLSSGSIVHGVLTADWLSAIVGTAAVVALATITRLVREVA